MGVLLISNEQKRYHMKRESNLCSYCSHVWRGKIKFCSLRRRLSERPDTDISSDWLLKWLSECHCRIGCLARSLRTGYTNDVPVSTGKDRVSNKYNKINSLSIMISYLNSFKKSNRHIRKLSIFIRSMFTYISLKDPWEWVKMKQLN